MIVGVGRALAGKACPKLFQPTSGFKKNHLIDRFYIALW